MHGIIHITFNNVSMFWIPLHNLLLWFPSGINLCLLWLQLLLCNAWQDASHYFPCNTTSQWFFSWIYSALKKASVLYRLFTMHWWCFPSTLSEKAINIAWSGNIILSKYDFGKGSLHINILFVYPFWKIVYIYNT